MALTPRQLRFCEEYQKSKNGREAAIKAGYSKNTAEGNLKTITDNPEVKAYLQRANQTAAERLGITAEYVLGIFKDLVKKSTEMVPVKDHKGRQVYVTNKDGDEVAAWTVYDGKTAVKAAELMAKHLKILSDKPEPPKPVDPANIRQPLNAEEASRGYSEMMKSI